jgi:7-cyano-7-deazaguanine synthase
MKKAVVLLSGGIDSATALAVALHQKFHCYALTFRYGQRHIHEIKAAETVAGELGTDRHLILDIPLDQLGGSTLFAGSGEVPKNRRKTGHDRVVPVTYVPARNTIFLSFAVAWAEVLKAYDIFIGVNDQDYSGYPDCRPEYIHAFTSMANLATRAGTEDHPLRINTPLIGMSKTQIIRKGMELGVDFSRTHSCYDPDPGGAACGQCDSCLFRKKGFAGAGVPDPTRYQSG